MNSLENNQFESTIINISLTNFLLLVIIFILNLAYISFLFNKSNAVNFLIYSVSDYAIFITNLNDIFGKFKNNLEYIRKKEDECKGDKKLDKEIYMDKLGFELNEKMSQLDLFKIFLEKKIFQKTEKTKDDLQYYDLNRIDLCYKLNEIVKLQKNADELDEKIERIEFDPNIIKINNEEGIEGDERYLYNYSCSSGVTQERLGDIKKKKEEIDNKMNDLIKSSKENASEHFCGAAFITFNTIKEQEDYLSQIPSSFFGYLLNFFKNLFYLFFSCCVKKDSLNYYKKI